MRRIDIVGVVVTKNRVVMVATILTYRVFGVVCVAVVVVMESAGIRRKPAPDMVFAAAEWLGVAIEDCLYVGHYGSEWVSSVCQR